MSRQNEVEVQFVSTVPEDEQTGPFSPWADLSGEIETPDPQADLREDERFLDGDLSEVLANEPRPGPHKPKPHGADF